MENYSVHCLKLLFKKGGISYSKIIPLRPNIPIFKAYHTKLCFLVLKFGIYKIKTNKNNIHIYN